MAGDIDASLLDASWGGLTANSYIDLGAAEAIAATIYYSEPWDSASSTEARKVAALLEATIQIDSRNWKGERYFPNQTLAFPRIPDGVELEAGFVNRVGPDANFDQIVSADNYLRLQQLRVLRAVVCQAIHVMKSEGEEAHYESQLQGLASISRSRRFGESISYREPSLVLCPAAWHQLRWYRGHLRVVRGGSHPGIFDER